MKPTPALADDLGYSDRREVTRAVRYGRAVDDPTLAPAAIAQARHVQELAERWSLRTPDGWPSLLGEFARNEAWMMLLPMLLVLPWIRHPVTIVLEAVMVIVLAQLLRRYATHAPALAARAEIANRVLVGEAVQEPPASTEQSLPWWRPRVVVRRSKPEAPSWVPIPLAWLVPLWTAWAGIVVAIGLTVPARVQDWLPIGYLFVWIEIERRLAEPVERQLGPAEIRRVRGYDVFRSGRGWKRAALSVLQLAAVGAMSFGIAASGWFKGNGVGAAFGFLFLLFFVYRDLASRWRLNHRSRPPA